MSIFILFFSVCPSLLSYRFVEAFQGIDASSEMAPKTGDNLLPEDRQPAEIGRESATVCDRDNSLLFLVCFLNDSDICS